MNPEQPSQTTISKLILQKINAYLRERNIQKSPSIWDAIHKWNYDHHLIKNLLKISNKILRALNKFHVFRIGYVYGAIGLGLGYATNQIEKFIENVERMDFEKIRSDIVFQKVLKNIEIRLKLQQAVNDNVLKNEDIQTILHFVLLNKVLTPQRDNLNSLVKSAIISLLRSQAIFKMVLAQTVKQIENNEPLIARQALKFLGSEQMDQIIIKTVPPLIKSENVQTLVSSQLINQINSQLNKQQNRQKAYEFLRQKII